MFDIVNPTAPVLLEKLVLKDSGGSGKMLASGDFALNFSPEGNILYVVSQDINPAAGGDFNFLHSLPVAADGTLTEPTEPTPLPVAADVRPLGVATR